MLLYNIQSFSQTLPSLHAVNYKKPSTSSDESFVLDFDNDDDCTSNCGSSFYGEAITNSPQLEACTADHTNLRYTLMTWDRDKAFIPKIVVDKTSPPFFRYHCG